MTQQAIESAPEEAFTFNPARQAAAERFQAAARRMHAAALVVDDIAMLLDDSADACSCCGTTRYRNWPQRQLRARVTGAAERLREIADVFDRRAHDDEFIGIGKVTP